MMFEGIEQASPAELAAVFAVATRRLGELGRQGAEAIKGELRLEHDAHISEGLGWLEEIADALQ